MQLASSNVEVKDGKVFATIDVSGLSPTDATIGELYGMLKTLGEATDVKMVISLNLTKAPLSDYLSYMSQMFSILSNLPGKHIEKTDIVMNKQHEPLYLLIRPALEKTMKNPKKMVMSFV